MVAPAFRVRHLSRRYRSFNQFGGGVGWNTPELAPHKTYDMMSAPRTNHSLEQTRASRSASDEFPSLLRLARAAQAER